MKKESTRQFGLYALGIAAMFIGGFLMLVVFGATTYQRTVDLQDENYHTREVLSYLATSLKADQATQIYEAEIDGRQVLVINVGDTGYANRIYVNDGNLVEDFGRIGSSLDPENASVITTNEKFEISHVNNLLVISTDEGDVKVNVRNDEVSAHE